jgi:hypothetical protein
MKSAVFDIECTDFSAVGAGIVTCVCIRPMDTGRTRTYHLGMYEFEASEDFGFLEREERALLEAVREEFAKFHILIGHNITRFDWPYLRSRAFRRDLEWHVYPALYDTFMAFRRTGFVTSPNGFGKPTARLAHIADFAKLKPDRTTIYPGDWWETIWGNKKNRFEALQNIIDHCQRDVRMNAQVFEFLWAADMRPVIKRAL